MSGVLVRLLPEWSLGMVDLHAVFASGRAAKAFAAFLVEALRDF